MKETLNFILIHRIKTHSDMFLTSIDAEAFVQLCREKKIRIYGFDGFFLLPDRHVQIEQDISGDYSKTDPEVAYELAIKFFQEHREGGIGYEIIYDDLSKDSMEIKAIDEKGASGKV